MFDTTLLYHITAELPIQTFIRILSENAQKIKKTSLFLRYYILKNLLTFSRILFIIILYRYIVRCFILKDRHTDAKARFSDEELLRKFRAGDDVAFEKIAARYLGLISSAAKRYRGMSPDIDDGDLVQEGMIALLSACRSYQSDGGMSFKNYSMLCIENRFISLLRHVTNKRSVPSQNIVSIEDEEGSAVDPTSSTLPEIVETREYIDSLHQILKDSLSDLEYNVAILHLSGCSYKEIADKLNVSLKTIDNAQTRIRQKLAR